MSTPHLPRRTQTHTGLVRRSQSPSGAALHFFNVGTARWLTVKRSWCHVFVCTLSHLAWHVVVERSVPPISSSPFFSYFPDLKDICDYYLVCWQLTKSQCLRSLTVMLKPLDGHVLDLKHCNVLLAQHSCEQFGANLCCPRFYPKTTLAFGIVVPQPRITHVFQSPLLPQRTNTKSRRIYHHKFPRTLLVEL